MTRSKISAQVRKVLRKFFYKKHWLCNVIFFIIRFLFMKKLNKKIKKKLKDEELDKILKQFDDFEFQDKKGKDNEDNIEKRLLTYIPYANRVIQQYENTKHHYIRLNISFVALISLFPYIFLVYFEIILPKLFPIIYGSLVCALLILLNLIYFQFKTPTRTTSQTTLWFYKGNVHDKRNQQISEDIISNFLNKFHRTKEDFIIEDLKQLFNLYLYQANYSNLASNSRRRSLIIISTYFIYTIIQLLSLFYLN